MEWQTHMLSGVVAGYAVTGGDWKGAVIGGIAAVIPDLDEPESKFGKIFFFLSIPIGMMFKHRTFTHSLLFVALASLCVYPFFGLNIAITVMVGLLAHIVGDMLTGKVKLYYPSDKSVGIPIPRSMFLIIDRFVRYGLVIVLVCQIIYYLNLGTLNFIKYIVTS